MLNSVSEHFLAARTIIGVTCPVLVDVLDRMETCQDETVLADHLEMICNAVGCSCPISGDRRQGLPTPAGIRRLLSRVAKIVSPVDWATFLVHVVPRDQWDMRISPELEARLVN